jgi:intein/homing endonuclease
MVASSPIFFAQEILTGAPEPPYNGRYLVGDHHIEWDQLVTQHDRICVLAARDHGKCSIRGSLVLRSDGKRVPIEEWGGGDLWAYNPQTHQFVRAYAPPSRLNGVKPVLRVQTRSGRVVTVTHNHPLRLLDQWCRADELEVGQRIAVPYETPMVEPYKSDSIPDAWMLGVWVGVGMFSGSSVVVSTQDGSVLKAIRSRFGPVHNGGCDYRLLGAQSRAHEVGLWGLNSHTMRVPQILFQANKFDLGDFLAGYLDTNAHINQHGGGSIEFYSMSEDLLRDVQHLLTRLKVLSVLSPKYGDGFKGPGYKSWRLTIRGKDILRFAGFVKPRGKRAEQLAALVRLQRAKKGCSGSALDRFPREVWDCVIHTDAWFRQFGYPRPSKGYAPTRAKVQAVAEADGNEKLKRLASAPVLWDEIVSIDDAGEQETWSIHVPGFENYLADDVVNHNTFFFDFALPIWKAVTMPGGIGFLFSASKDQAKLILEDIKVELETNPKLQHLVPNRKNKWRSDAIRLTNGHTIYARGYGTKVRGRHPHYIICDDILNDETAYSEVVRQKEKDYFFTAVTNMITPKGQIVVIGTPFHQLDLYADLRKNPQYVYRKYPAVDKNEKVLWPERYNKKRLKERREEIGPIRFSREFGCDPVSDDMSLFPSGLFRGETIEQYTVRLGAPMEYWREIGVTPFMGVDIAMSTTAKADYFVIWVMGPDARGNRWIMDIIRHRGLGFQEQLGFGVMSSSGRRTYLSKSSQRQLKRSMRSTRACLGCVCCLKMPSFGSHGVMSAVWSSPISGVRRCVRIRGMMGSYRA